MRKLLASLLFVLSSFVLFAQENDFKKDIWGLHEPNLKYDMFQNDILEPHRQGEKIWVNDSIVYFNYAGDDQWLPTDLYRVTTRNLYGKNTSGIKDKIDFDLFEWVPNYIDTTVYYFNNTKKSYLRKKWNAETKEYSDTIWYSVYNEAGNYIEIFWRFGNYRSKYLDFYDENGNDTLTLGYDWDIDENKWYLDYVLKSTFNEYGILVERIVKEFDYSADSLINSRKYIFNVEGDLIIGYTKLLWDKETKSWNNFEQWYYNYNDFNLNDSTIVKKFNDSGEWVNKEKTIYSYNSIGKYDSIYKYNWDSIWVNKQKEIYTYINDEYLTEYSKFYWDSDSLRWDIDSKDVYTYDDNFNRLKKIHSRRNYEGIFDKSSAIGYSWSEFEVSGIEENDYSKIDIFPNPVKDYLTIDCESVNEIKNVNIYSMQGKPVRSLNKIRDKGIDVQDLGKGLYIIEVNTINGKKYNKIIKY